MVADDQRSNLAPSWKAWLDTQRRRRDAAAEWLRSAWEYQRWPQRSIAPYFVLLPVSRSIVHGAWINPGMDWAESELREPWYHELFLQQARADRSAERGADMLEELCERERPRLAVATEALGLPQTASWPEATTMRAALVDAIVAFAADRSYLVEGFPPRSRMEWESYVTAADAAGLGEMRFGEEHRRLRQGRELLEREAMASSQGELSGAEPTDEQGPGSASEATVVEPSVPPAGGSRRAERTARRRQSARVADGSRKLGDPNWVKMMAVTDEYIRKHGKTRLQAFIALEYPPPTTDRTLRNWERWWRQRPGDDG